jgi:hypothetical protein
MECSKYKPYTQGAYFAELVLIYFFFSPAIHSLTELFCIFNSCRALVWNSKLVLDSQIKKIVFAS